MPATTLPTPSEDLYDEGAGAVWGSLSDEGAPSPNIPGGTGYEAIGALDSGFDDTGGVYRDYGDDGRVGGWGTGDGNAPPEFLSGADTSNDPRVRDGDMFSFYMGSIEWNMNGFHRTLTAADPDGNAILWSISDASGKFQINPQTGEISTIQIPEFGATYTFSAMVTSGGASDTATVHVYVATPIRLKSINFTSDHGMLECFAESCYSVAAGSRQYGTTYATASLKTADSRTTTSVLLRAV